MNQLKKKYLVVLVNYLNWQDTVECIGSLQSGGIKGDILIVENGSGNGSLKELSSRYPDIKIIDVCNNLGFSGGNNLGIKYAQAEGYEYIILLNNDTLIHEGALEKLITEMDNNPEFSIGTGQIRCYPDTGKLWYAGGKLVPWRGLAVHKGFGKSYTDVTRTGSCSTEFISGCYMCIRSADIAELGLLEEKFFLYLEDIEYSARAVNKGLKLLYVPESLIYHKWRGETEFKFNTLYYAVRNRLLLIEMVFPAAARIYFLTVIRIKLVFWFFNNRLYFRAARKGLNDYRKKYFGPVTN